MAAVALVLSLAFSASLAAVQKPAARPSFSGVWIIQPPNKAAGKERTIKQDDKTISVSGTGRPATYYLDGVERRETVPMRGGDIVVLTKAVWEKNTVVITFVSLYPNKMEMFEREVWSIDAKGQFVIDLAETAQGQPGPSMKIVHKKKS